MSWDIPEIKEAFEKGATGEYSHMIVAFDDFDYEEYAIHVPKGENPWDHRPANGDRVRECYSYALSWESQAAEPRAQHWEYSSEQSPGGN